MWRVLINLDEYPSWNPFIVSALGTPAVGNRLKNRLHPPGGKQMTFSPTVTVVDEPKTFEWLGRFGLPGVFNGRHRFELHTISGGTRLVHSEKFNGILVRSLHNSLNTKSRQGFEAMNKALKNRAEALVKANR